MFFDLNVPVPPPALLAAGAGGGQPSKKGKQKQNQQQASLAPAENTATAQCLYSSGQIAAIETRIDLLVHLGYTVLALNQIMQRKIDSKTHVNWLDGLVPKLRKRQGILILRRLTVILDDESERGNGINPQNIVTLNSYDIISLRPTTFPSFSAACLTHSVPSPHTAHVISVPVTLPRLPFHLKHTLIRTALKNGAVFEIDYSGAVGAENDRRNWWGGAREVARVTKGKGILVSGGIEEDKYARAPRDVANLITLLGLAQNLSHDTVTQTPKTVLLRAESRKTYRAVLSEPKLVLPPELQQPSVTREAQTVKIVPASQISSQNILPVSSSTGNSVPPLVPGSGHATPVARNASSQKKGKKRPRDEADGHGSGASTPISIAGNEERTQKKKKNK